MLLDKKTFKFDTIITKSITLVASWKELPSQDKQNITKMVTPKNKIIFLNKIVFFAYILYRGIKNEM